MHAIIVASGGPDGGDDGRRRSGHADLIIGADGGAARALAWGLEPDIVIGDMDSLPAPVRAALEAAGREFIVHPRAKDETDLELALTYAVERGCTAITILGALGGRLDHTLANLLLLALPALAGVRVRIVGGEEEALLIRGGQSVEVEGRPGDIVSLLPLGGDARGVTTHGLAWRLAGDRLAFGASRGVSNEMTAPAARVELEHGCLLLVHGPRAEE